MLVREWGKEAPRKVTLVKERWQRARNGLDENGRGWLDWYVDAALQPAELAAVLRVLVA